MDTLRAAILGIIQGLTEFLPVSSSGHLELAKFFLGDQSVSDESMLMTVVLHAATALATIVVFRKDILEILRGLTAMQLNESAHFVLKIILSMVPAAVVGLLYEDILDELFHRQIPLVAAMLVVTGLLLFVANKAKTTKKDVSYKDAFLVGVAQAIAILPGISRSGATIGTSVLLGIDRTRAARFSFLMVIPLILGKMAKDLLDGDLTHAAQPASLAIGFITAFVTGLFACTLMIKIVQNSKLTYFAVYCMAIAVLAFLGWQWMH